MNSQEYYSLRRSIVLYSFTLTIIITAYLIKKNILFSDNEELASLLVPLLLSISSTFLLRIAGELKQKEIHGLSSIVSSVIIIILLRTTSMPSKGMMSIIADISLVISLYLMINGIIRFILSLIYSIKHKIPNNSNSVEYIESVTSIITSIISLVVSVLALFL